MWPHAAKKSKGDNYMPENIFGDEVVDTQPSPEEGQEGVQQAEPVTAPEEGQPAERQYAGKFKSEDELERGYINLMDRLGRDLGQFHSVEDLERAYIEAEKDLGRQKPRQEKQQQNPELEQLRQTVAQQQMQMQQLVGYLQTLHQPQATQQQGESKEEPIDPTALLEEFYENPQQALTKLVNPIVQQQIQQIVPEYAKQIDQELAPFRQQMQLGQLAQRWSSVVDEMSKELPDFNEHKSDVAQLIEQNPDLLRVAHSYPDGIKFVLQTAYERVKASKLQQQGMEHLAQQQRQQSVLQKQAGRMGSSRKVLIKQPTYEEKVLETIFGEPDKKKGIFG